MDIPTLVTTISPTIDAAGAAFMFDRGTMAAGEPLDLDGLSMYVLGRGGALGDVDGAAIVGMPLFAGWRAQPLADDTPGRAMQLTNVLREHRGSAHVCGIASTGLTGAQAHYLAKGDGQMSMMGWQEPWPDVTGLEDHLAEAEAVTDRIVEAAFAVLDENQADTLARVVADIGAAVRS